MSDEDELAGDPEAEAIKPFHTKQMLVGATLAGVAFGLLLAVAGYVFEQHYPHFSAPLDAGPPPTPPPDLSIPDAGAPEPAPWLE